MTDKQHSTTDPKLDATGEFFSVGAPLHALRAGYVNRAADEELFVTLQGGGNAYVIAPDRSGKSSLIAAVAARLKSSEITVAVIDLAQISERDGGTDAGRWYYNIAYRLLRQLRLKTDLQTWWQDKSMLSNRQRLVEFYLEIVLANINERIVIFIDEIQYAAELPFAEHLLASIRAAHNSRVTDPEFSRLGFALFGECDTQSLVSHDGLSPFAVSTEVKLVDFSREQLGIFRTELNLALDDADRALDRIFAWTNGQPYLTQKLARSVAREDFAGEIHECVDRIVQQQLVGRSALHNEPHLSQISRKIVNDRKDREALLTLYGKLRKGVAVAYAPESKIQRKLLSIGLVIVTPDGRLAPRNRVYASVFSAKWANENLSIHWRGPMIAIAIVFVIAALPFWYTQLLPRPYVRILSEPAVELTLAANAYDALQSFPGHADSANNLYRNHLSQRARRAESRDELNRIRSYAIRLPDGEAFSNEMLATFWERQMKIAMSLEQRDKVLIAALESLIVPEPARRRTAANMIGNDYPQLVGTVPAQAAERVVYDGENQLLSFATGAKITQWSMSGNTLQQRATWALSALEITPLVRRLSVETDDVVRRLNLRVELTHARLNDLRMKLIAPSGRSLDLDFADARPATGGAFEFARDSFRDLSGEAVLGTWSLSIRDEAAAVPGSLVEWTLMINGKANLDAPDRPLAIPDPIARESDDIWFSSSGRYAIARSKNSDSARLWDLLYAQPARTIAVQADERVVGLSGGAEYLITARQDTIYLWRTRDGRRQTVLDVGAGNTSVIVSDDGRFLLLIRAGDAESTVNLWSVDDARQISTLTIAGAFAQLALSADGRLLAVADYDRAIRVWDLDAGEQLAQIDLPLPPSRIELSADGRTVGVVHGEQGLSLWSIAEPEEPLLIQNGNSDWELAFSPSGSRIIAGSGRDGYQTYRTSDGAIAGPPLGSDYSFSDGKLLAFSDDENFVITASADSVSRLWMATGPSSESRGSLSGPEVWREAFDTVSTIAPGGRLIAIGDRQGHVHFQNIAASQPAHDDVQNDVSYIGHASPVASLTFSDDSALAASIDDAGGVRIWDSQSGMPRPFRASISASQIDSIVFSPSSELLAIAGGQRLWLMNTRDGNFVADIDTAELRTSVDFADDNSLYLAGSSGVLRLLAADRSDSWNLRSLWTGNSGLQRVAVSPRKKLVLLIDDTNSVSLLDVENGRIGAATLQLPDRVSDVVFSPSDSRILLRTSRWVHRANLSPAGLVWLEAIRAPKVLRGSGMALDADEEGRLDPLASRIVLLTRDTGFVEVAELAFTPRDGATLIGGRDDLINEWRQKLSIDTASY